MEDSRRLSPLVSVVILTRNRAALLRDVLEDLVRQSRSSSDFEIVVVDDGSEDETRVVVEDFSRDRGPTTRHVWLDRRGVNAARNAGLNAARAEAIIFLDDDVAVPPDWLQAFLDAKERVPSADCFGGRILPRFEADLPRMCSLHLLSHVGFDMGMEQKDVSFVCGGNMLITRKAVERAGVFSEQVSLGGKLKGSGYGDESEWEARLLRAGGRIVYVPDAVMWHRRLSQQLTRRALLQSSWRRGKGQALIGPLTMQSSLSVMSGLWRLGMSAMHTLRTCWGGIFDSAYWLGYSVSAAGLLLQRQDAGYLHWLPTRFRDRVGKLLGGFRVTRSP